MTSSFSFLAILLKKIQEIILSEYYQMNERRTTRMWQKNLKVKI